MDLPQYLAWLGNPTFWLTALAGAVGAVWALSEIIGEFRAETGWALRTSGAWLLMIVNFAAAAMIFLLAISLIPSTRNWPSALFIGIAWPKTPEKLNLIDSLMGRNVDEDTKKVHLAALVMNDFSRGALDDFIRENKKRRVKS